MRILVAEDIPANQELILIRLTRLGYDVETVDNGAEALERLKETHFDLLITDIHMPVMNGFELVRKIREELCSDIPVIAVTGSLATKELKTIYEHGIDDVLAKPYNAKNLREKIQVWLEAGGDFLEVKEPPEEIDYRHQPLFNVEQKDMFWDSIGKEKAAIYFSDFKDDFQSHIEKIQEAAADPEALYEELHALSSLAGNIGLSKLCHFCKHLMTHPEEEKRAASELETLYRNSIDAFHQNIFREERLS